VFSCGEKANEKRIVKRCRRCPSPGKLNRNQENDGKGEDAGRGRGEGARGREDLAPAGGLSQAAGGLTKSQPQDLC